MPKDSTAAPVRSGLLEIGDREFHLFRELILAETGIQMKEAKRTLVASRLGMRLRNLGLETFGEYYEYLQGPCRKEELGEFVNCVTTNKTSFFREEGHFVVLGDWLTGRRAEGGGKTTRIWSAACSTGEEPYSIAITALETLGDAAGLRILAGDIDTAVLKTAKTGIYPAADLEPVAANCRKRYFCRGVGEWDGFAQVKPALRDVVEFRRFNLVSQPWAMTGRFNAVFLRNVAIYFGRETQREIFEQVAIHLEPGGLLFVGSSESLFWLPELYSPVSHAVYRYKGGVP